MRADIDIEDTCIDGSLFAKGSASQSALRACLAQLTSFHMPHARWRDELECVMLACHANNDKIGLSIGCWSARPCFGCMAASQCSMACVAREVIAQEAPMRVNTVIMISPCLHQYRQPCGCRHQLLINAQGNTMVLQNGVADSLQMVYGAQVYLGCGMDDISLCSEVLASPLSA